MKSKLYVSGILLATLIPVFWVAQAFSNGPASSGKQIFIGARCANCHSVSSAGIAAKFKSGKMAGPDLAGIAARRKAPWIARYITQEEALDGQKHLSGFKGSDEELAALIDWLLEQKAE